MTTAKAIFAMLCLCAAPQFARAAVLFQSDPDTTSGFLDGRAAGSTAVGRVSVSTTTTIGGIGVLDYLPSSADLKFFIADPVSGQLLYLSDAQLFAADTGSASNADLTYKVSAPFSFTFDAGSTYAIGSVADGLTYTYADFSQTASANGFTSLLGNVNVSDFTNPALLTGEACCSIGFELLSPASPVPEPASIALLTVGVAGLSLRRRRPAP